jgi:hypothetical protein
MNDTCFLGMQFNGDRKQGPVLDAAAQLRSAVDAFRAKHGRAPTQALCAEGAAAELGDGVPEGLTVTGRRYVAANVVYVGDVS